MNDIFVFIMVLMGALAILDLIVGVSNDAVNFIGAAVGSKAASFKTIMIIASIGVMMGAIFSNGMMEVARRGVFHPDMFLFDEVMMIFLAVAYRVQIGSICRSLNDSTNQLPKDIAELQPSQMELEKQK